MCCALMEEEIIYLAILGVSLTSSLSQMASILYWHFQHEFYCVCKVFVYSSAHDGGDGRAGQIFDLTEDNCKPLEGWFGMFMTATKPHVTMINLHQFSGNLLCTHSQRNWPFIFIFGGPKLGCSHPPH